MRLPGRHWLLCATLALTALAHPAQAGEFAVRVLLDGGVRRVPLEAYVAGTVGREMPASWSGAALRAQAVVSRTYALRAAADRRGERYDVEAGTRSQVYAPGRVAGRVRAAVGATRDQVLTWRGEPILAAFHATAGGRTAAAAEVWGEARPYLVSLRVEGEDASPDTYWRVPVSRTTLGRALAQAGLDVGPVIGLQVRERTPSGRVQRLEVAGAKRRTSLSGRVLRDALGESVLRSTLFDVRESPSGFVLVGSGHGHGVGMSQWGARAMAERGAEYAEILRAFYPGTRLERASKVRARARHAERRVAAGPSGDQR